MWKQVLIVLGLALFLDSVPLSQKLSLRSKIDSLIDELELRTPTEGEQQQTDGDGDAESVSSLEESVEDIHEHKEEVDAKLLKHAIEILQAMVRSYESHAEAKEVWSKVITGFFKTLYESATFIIDHFKTTLHDVVDDDFKDINKIGEKTIEYVTENHYRMKCWSMCYVYHRMEKGHQDSHWTWQVAFMMDAGCLSSLEHEVFGMDIGDDVVDFKFKLRDALVHTLMEGSLVFHCSMGVFHMLGERQQPERSALLEKLRSILDDVNIENKARP